MVAGDHDLVVRTAPLRTEDMTLDIDALEELIGERTRVVAFTLASNAVGSIPMPAASQRPLTPPARWRGPTRFTWRRTVAARTGARPGRDALLAVQFFGRPRDRLDPARYSGVAAGGPGAPGVRGPPGHRFETGTQSHEAIAGALAAIEYLRRLEAANGDGDLDAGFALIEERERT